MSRLSGFLDKPPGVSLRDLEPLGDEWPRRDSELDALAHNLGNLLEP